MSTKTPQFPSLYVPDDVIRDYAPRTQEFMQLGALAGLPHANADATKGALVIIDMQNDFVRPNGALSVPHAEDDVRRLVEFIYTNASHITAIYATLDSHYPLQIFYSEWWENPQTLEHPAPFTVITADDIKNGVYRACIDPVWSHEYVYALARLGRNALMIWPKHTMIGTWGHNIVPALYEAIAWHSAARKTLPVYLTKGDVPQTERYGAFASEVEYLRNPRGGTDSAVLEAIAKFKRTWWAGEAKTHCLIESQKQAVGFVAANPNLKSVLNTMYFLTDCTSPILHPTIDFDGAANAELTRMAALGVKLVRSTDPIN